jgi:hypothetical protein
LVIDEMVALYFLFADSSNDTASGWLYTFNAIVEEE